MKIIARLILIIAVMIWLGPAVIGFLLVMLLFWLLVELAGWNKSPQ